MSKKMIVSPGNVKKTKARLVSLMHGLAIVSQGNSHDAITTGQYVYVFDHSTLSEGLYIAKSNVSANAELSTSNLNADAIGGLNDLKAADAALNSHITDIGLDKTSTVVSLGKQANGYYSLYVVLPKKYTGKTVTVSSVKRIGDATEYKNDFSVDNVLTNGFFYLYTNSSTHNTVGDLYMIQYTIS